MTTTTNSADGTRIAFERTGDGPPLIFVDGALSYRGSGPAGPMAAELASRFTVYTYDRRGRGESGPGTDISVERELEDLEAVAKEAGGTPFLAGVSSGAVLALEAACHGVGAPKVAMYEPPVIVDGTHRPLPDDWTERLAAAVAEGRNGDAVADFLRFVDVPGFGIAMMRLLPAWKRLKAVAPTLRYDFAFMADLQRGRPLPAARWAAATMPVLVADGGKSPTWMRNGVHAVADTLPNATYRTLPGQTHLVKAKVLAPAVAEFLSS